MLKHDLPKEKRIEYGLMKCNFMIEIKQTEDCLSLAKDLLKLDPKNIAIRITIATAKMILNQIWDAYLEIMRTGGQIETLKK